VRKKIIRLLSAERRASRLVIVITWIPLIISDGLNVVANPGRLDQSQEVRGARERVREPESTKQSWGDDVTERAGHDAEIKQLFAVVLSLQPTPVPHGKIQVFIVVIGGEQVDDWIYDVDGDN
jgi:hypothetical protein